MKLYHFPSPNPQKVTFALGELGLEYEMVPVDLAKGEQRKPEFLAINPFGRVPVLVDGDLTLWDSHAILAYLGRPGRCGQPRRQGVPTRSDGSSSCRGTSPLWRVKWPAALVRRRWGFRLTKP